MNSPTYYQKAQAQAWMNRNSNNTTVGAHNSFMTYCASLMDIWSRIDLVVPAGSTKLVYPQVIYHGAKPSFLPDPNGQYLSLVGSLEPTRADRAANDANFGSSLPSAYYFVGEEFARELADTTYEVAQSGQRATGDAFEEEESDGWKFVGGPFAATIIDDLDPATAIVEPASANYLRDWITGAKPFTAALVVAARAGNPLSTVLNMQATDATLQSFNLTTAQFVAAADAGARAHTAAIAHASNAFKAAGITFGLVLAIDIIAAVAAPAPTRDVVARGLLSPLMKQRKRRS